MSTEAQLNTDPTPKPKPKGKGKALGIPKWGWIAALAIGLVIGYILLRKSSSAGGSNPAPETSGNPSAGESGAGQSSGDGGGGAIGVPPNFLDYLKAIGVSGGQSSQTSASPTTSESTSATNASDAAANPGPQDPQDPTFLLNGQYSNWLNPPPATFIGNDPGFKSLLTPPPATYLGNEPGFGSLISGIGSGPSSPAPAAPVAGPSITPPLPKGKVAD